MIKIWLNVSLGQRFAAFILVLLISACQPVINLENPPLSTATKVSLASTKPAAPLKSSEKPAVALTDTPDPDSSSGSCVYNPVTAQLLIETDSRAWIDWVEKLSGEEPVTIDSEETTITSRFSHAMFQGHPNARAFDFVLATVKNWYPETQIEVMPFSVHDDEDHLYIWNNLIVTIPGVTRPDETVILSAHLDSTTKEKPEQAAPGAEDNGTGSAALLEAARLFRDQQFERTIQIIWFTGEEQGRLGSKAFVEGLEHPLSVVGVINLDMFGFDSDGDRCFEIHVGTLPASDKVGQCFIQSIDTYNLGLNRFDYLTDLAMNHSDHGSFWDAGIGAIEILENMFDQKLSSGCPNKDPNPDYHSTNDTVDKIDPSIGISIVRAALAATAGLAIPIE